METIKTYFQFITLFLIALLFLNPLESLEQPSLEEFCKSRATIVKEIREVVRERDYPRLKLLITKHIGKTISMARLNQIAIAESSDILKRAIQATKAIKNLPEFTGISKNCLLAISLFIEAELPSYTSRGITYILAKKARISHDVEYIPKNDFVFIHLPKKILGVGYKKVVSKSILYNIERPEIVAHLQQSGGMDREFKITESLNGHEGIFEVMAISKNKIHGNLKTSLFSKLYKPGSLDRVFNRNIHFSFKEKVAMALNVIKGLEHMHLHGIAHNDLGPKNHLVNIIRNSQTGDLDITHVLADFGRSRSYRYLHGYKPQGNTLYKAPEGFLQNTLSGSAYKRCDIFALGCVYFRLFYGRFTVWQKLKPIWSNMKSMRRLKSYLYVLIRNQTKPRRDYIASKKRNNELSKEEKIEFLILKMVHARPKCRPSATAVRRSLEAIYDSL